MSLENMGVVNEQAGICGFASCFYAFYNKNPGANTENGVLNSDATSRVNFIKLVGGYLADIQDKKPNIATEIQEFSRTFTGFETFNLRDYINKAKHIDRLSTVRWSEDFSVAMTPDGVVYLLKNFFGFPSARIKTRGLTGKLPKPPRECIIGLASSEVEKGAMFRGLQHWVYKRDQTIYSWGKIFAHSDYQESDAFKDFNKVCYIIAL